MNYEVAVRCQQTERDSPSSTTERNLNFSLLSCVFFDTSLERCRLRLAKGNSGSVKSVEREERTLSAAQEAFPYDTVAMADTFLLPNQTQEEWGGLVKQSQNRHRVMLWFVFVRWYWDKLEGSHHTSLWVRSNQMPACYSKWHYIPIKTKKNSTEWLYNFG